MKNPFFSVIITSYNRSDLLEESLESLKKQTFKNFEAFIIDDGSTDGTFRVFDKFKGNENWHFIRFEKNRGYPYCKNSAFKKSVGEYISFLDSDDIWLPNRLEEFYKYVKKHPNHGFVFSNGYILQDGIMFEMFKQNRNVPTGKIPPYMAISNIWLPYVTTNVAIKKKIIEKTGEYNEKMIYLGDTEYFVRVLKNTECGVIKKPLSIYRIHPISLTQSRDECVKESLISLETAQAPEKIYNELHDFIHLSQAKVLIKNAFGSKARQYLKKTKTKNCKILFLYFSSYTPSIILKLLKKLYFSYKKFKFIK